jgi:PQQ enzyme repeat
MALQPLTGKAKWQAPSDIPAFFWCAINGWRVAFSGRLTGEFKAFDADSGAKLWQSQTGSGIEGQPVTWQELSEKSNQPTCQVETAGSASSSYGHATLRRAFRTVTGFRDYLTAINGRTFAGVERTRLST